MRRSDGLWLLRGGALLCVGGMGLEAAALAAGRLADAGAAGLVSFGLAGGLDPSLSPGSIVLPRDIIGSDGARFQANDAWREAVSAAVAHARPGAAGAVAAGTLLTSGVSIAAIADKAAAFRDTGAVAVDMESAAVAQVAATRGLPFIAARVIVDTAADALPPAVAAAGRAGRLSLMRLVLGLAAAPLDVVAVIGLARRYRAALRALECMAGAGLLV